MAIPVRKFGHHLILLVVPFTILPSSSSDISKFNNKIMRTYDRHIRSWAFTPLRAFQHKYMPVLVPFQYSSFELTYSDGTRRNRDVNQTFAERDLLMVSQR